MDKTLCTVCQKKPRKSGTVYCGKSCNPALCSICGERLINGACKVRCKTCNRHVSTRYFGECLNCRAKARQSIAAKKTSFVPKPQVPPSYAELERQIATLQLDNAVLKQRMGDMEAQMALIIESVSEICTRNLEQMEAALHENGD